MQLGEYVKKASCQTWSLRLLLLLGAESFLILCNGGQKYGVESRKNEV